METLLMIVAGITATSLMTCSNQIFSNFFSGDFDEVQIVNRLIKFKKESNSGFHDRKNIFGWLLYYAFGIVWSMIFLVIWKDAHLPKTVYTGALLGVFSGLISVCIWVVTFLVFYNPAKVYLSKLTMRIITGHAIFGATVYTVFKLWFMFI